MAVIPGSHKANLACPQSMIKWKQHQEHVLEVNGKAGDAIIFTETLTHGTLPWTAAHEAAGAAIQIQPRHPVLRLGRARDNVFRIHR